jgi:hypothetical protein
MAESDDPRFQGAQFLGTVSDFAAFKKEKERKIAEAEARRKLVENQDNRPDAKIIPFPGRLDKTTEITPEGLETEITRQLTEEELKTKEKTKDTPKHKHPSQLDTDDDKGDS